jgi:DNA-directed RNA polymerase specialized sigma24 family protein
MSAILLKRKREDLFQEIRGVFRKWPDLERKVFSLAHYQGKSMEAISRSLEVDVEIVRKILGECERELYTSLRNHREPGFDIPATISAKSA